MIANVRGRFPEVIQNAAEKVTFVGHGAEIGGYC
jgi:hypothetical protein